MIEETLRAKAQVVTDMLSTHDTDDFMSRLAARINQDADRPDRPRREAAPVPGPGAHGDWPSHVTPGPPPSFSHPRHRLTRPAFHRLRRRPTPVVPVNLATQPAAVLDHVRRLCETVVQADDTGRLIAAFEAHYDEAGARAFACLLYIVGRRDAALYWWRFAAGAGDPLAAHLLAAHYSAAGTVPEARVWRAFAAWLGFRGNQHIPEPVCATARLDDGLARRAPRGNIAQEFMDRDRLPKALLQG